MTIFILMMSLIVHELGHIFGAIKLKIYDGLKLTMLGVATRLKGRISRNDYIMLLALGVLTGFVPLLLFYDYVSIVGFIFYFGCCVPDLINIFKARISKAKYYDF